MPIININRYIPAFEQRTSGIKPNKNNKGASS